MPALDSTNVWEDKHIPTKEKKTEKSNFSRFGRKNINPLSKKSKDTKEIIHTFKSVGGETYSHQGNQRHKSHTFQGNFPHFQSNYPHFQRCGRRNTFLLRKLMALLRIARRPGKNIKRWSMLMLIDI